MLVQYAKADAEDIIIRLSFTNRGTKSAPLHALPTLWFRNTWSWGRTGEGYPATKPSIERRDERSVIARHVELGDYLLQIDSAASSPAPELLFTENDTNNAKLFGSENQTPYVKDAFHRYVVEGDRAAVNPAGTGTKAAWHWQTELAPGETKRLQLRLTRLEEPTAKRTTEEIRFRRRRRDHRCSQSRCR